MSKPLVTLEPYGGGNAYLVLYENGVCIGLIYQEIDGYHVYNDQLPTPMARRGGYWTEHVMYAIADELVKLNRTWDEIMHTDPTINQPPILPHVPTKTYAELLRDFKSQAESRKDPDDRAQDRATALGVEEHPQQAAPVPAGPGAPHADVDPSSGI
jgi:hypothetical protein